MLVIGDTTHTVSVPSDVDRDYLRLDHYNVAATLGAATPHTTAYHALLRHAGGEERNNKG